jgi:hypothetical protein
VPFRVKTAPADEPVSLTEAKSQLNLETAEDDDLLALLIAAAREHAEAYCNRGLVTQTVELKLSAFPGQGVDPARFHAGGAGYGYGFFPYNGFACGDAYYRFPYGDPKVELPFGKLSETPNLSLKYINSAGNEVTLTADTDFVIDAVSVPARLYPAFGKTWPVPRRQWDAVTVTYDVGTDIDGVPAGIKQAMLLLIASMYEHRTIEVEKALVPIKFSYDSLLSPFKVYAL